MVRLVLRLLALCVSLASAGAWAERPASAAACAGCHGEDGRAAAVPSWGRIAGQNYEYLVYALKLYRAGGRSGLNAGLMSSYVRGLADDEITALARYYADLANQIAAAGAEARDR